MTIEQIREGRAILTRPEETVFSVARLLGVSCSTIYKYVPEFGKQLAAGEDRPMPDVTE
ncbi:hypothetical protein [Nocardia sp. NPDC059691]|uniref:hypothetical protein n=1 Tax=Nocardia sp. NPDC059691 TaxID=3346908 RepID=UPI0036B7082E